MRTKKLPFAASPVLVATLLSAATLTLSACGDVERTFGLTRDIPDEFTVGTQAPLSMPPDFTLRAPQPGAARPQEVSSQAAAEAALAPDTALAGAGLSGAGQAGGPSTQGQQALVAQAGPAAPGNIRAKVDSEVALDRTGNLTDRLMFWQPGSPPGTVLDAPAEARRLRENAALGLPPTAGTTPIIQDKPKSTFLGIF